MLIKLTDYLSPDEKNATVAMREALSAVHDGDTLALGEGALHFYPDGAEIRHYYISNNTAGDKPIGIPIIGKKNITLDGEGAELIFHGRMLPVVIDECENITVKNLSIDCAMVLYSQAEIVEADKERTVLKYSDEFPCRVDEKGFFCFGSVEGERQEVHSASPLALEFERSSRYPLPHPSSSKNPYFPYCGAPRDHGFLSFLYKNVRLSQVGENLIEMHGNLGLTHSVGNILVQTFSTREFPAILINNSALTALSDINIYYTGGMGVVGQLCDGILLERVSVMPREDSGRVLSANDDATHFVACRGKLELSGCKLLCTMDDSCNIHGIYALCRKVEGKKLTVGFGHNQQKGMRICRVGDSIAVINLKNCTEPIAVCRVLCETMVNENEYVLELDRNLPPIGELWAIENLSACPEIHIHGCECGLNRPRGFLVASRSRILIEKTKFYNMHQGINIACEQKDWFESGETRDITIRDCDFDNSAYAGGCAITASPELYEEKPKNFFLGKIVIENNLFRQAERRIAKISGAEEVIIRGNRFICDSSLPSHGENDENGLIITDCGKVEAEEICEEKQFFS